MCGRFDQHLSNEAYARALGWDIAALESDSQAAPKFNVSPGSYRPLMHLQDGQPHVDDVFWGYRPRWAADKKIQIAINARVEKAASGYFGRLFKTGRAVVAANGWYEWTGDKGNKQPWYIRSATQQPIFMAALANFGPFKEHQAEAGFVIITTDAEGGMVDVHDRRPVVLSAEDARLWLDPGLPTEQAEQLLRFSAQPAAAFAWYPVSRDVNKPGTESSLLIEPA